MKQGQRNTPIFLLLIHSTIFCSVIFTVNLKLATATYQVPDFYYYCTERIYVGLSTKMITIRFVDKVTEHKKEALIKAHPILKGVSDEGLPFGLLLIETKQALDKVDISEAVQRLNKLPEVKYCTPVFQYRNLKLILMDEFVARFKPDITEEGIQSLNKENRVTIVKKSPYRHNRYLLRVMNPKDTKCYRSRKYLQ